MKLCSSSVEITRSFGAPVLPRPSEGPPSSWTLMGIASVDSHPRKEPTSGPPEQPVSLSSHGRKKRAAIRLRKKEQKELAVLNQRRSAMAPYAGMSRRGAGSRPRGGI